MFSISAVCATNETADVTQNQDTPIAPEEISDSGDNGNVIIISGDNASYSHASNAGNVNNNNYASPFDVGDVENQNQLPVLSVSVDHDEDALLNDYVDVSIDYNNNSFSIDNKNLYFTVSQNDNSIKNAEAINNANSHNLMSVFTSTKNNNVLLNVSFLNSSNQTVNLLDSDNLIAILWNMIISFFNSIFK